MNNTGMKTRANIQIELLKLTGGDRLLRLSDPESGLALERKLDPKEPVVRQKNRLRAAFEAALARCELAAA